MNIKFVITKDTVKNLLVFFKKSIILFSFFTNIKYISENIIIINNDIKIKLEIIIIFDNKYVEYFEYK